jgi:uncharacterized protein YlxW (UPF0749 family)
MRVDASLDALLADALASDYANTSPNQSTGRLRVFFIAGAATLVTLVLGMAIAQTRIQATENSSTRDALVQRVVAADRRVQELEATVLTAQNDLLNAEAAALAGTSLGDQARLRLERLRSATGQTEVFGDGVSVTVDDAPIDPLLGDETPPGQVIDRDLQMIVNGLWQAGATDIAINGRRLTPTSAIRAAGDAILVNYRPMSPPYVVSAIGPDADQLAGRFRENPAGLLLEELETQYGVIWELQTVGNISLPAASTTFKNSEDAP